MTSAALRIQRTRPVIRPIKTMNESLDLRPVATLSSWRRLQRPITIDPNLSFRRKNVMHLLRPYSYRLTLAGIALAMLCAAIPGHADPVPATQNGPAGTATAPDPSKLQVSYAN